MAHNGSAEAGTVAGDARLWRAIDVFRVAALVYAVVLYGWGESGYRHPVGGWVVLALMTCWTLTLARWRRRDTPVMVTDLAVAVLAVLSTAVLDTPVRIVGGAQTLPAMWSASAVLGWAVWKGWRAGRRRSCPGTAGRRGNACPPGRCPADHRAAARAGRCAAPPRRHARPIGRRAVARHP